MRNFLKSMIPALAGAVAFCAGLCHAQNIAAPAIRLDFRIVSNGKTLRTSADGISRFDFILSEMALQDQSGTWIPSEEWFAYISAGEGRLQADTIGSPAGGFRSIRFRVGLDEATDTGDPVRWKPGHPLHPDVNHLHWGWQGGYVHLACEGKSERGAFSYHLAGKEDPMVVEIPVSFRGGGPVTLGITVDADRILAAADGEGNANSTHSRPGDELARRMKASVATAFRSTGVRYDLFQPVRPVTTVAKPLPAGTRPFPADITRRFPQVEFPADNPLTVEGVALGKRLFFDPVLSINGSQSCASCHVPEQGFSDPRRVSSGAMGQPGKRNAMPLSNLAWAHSGFFWDGRAKTLREQILMPIADPAEMGETIGSVVAKLGKDATYPAEFQQAHAEGISADTLAKSIEQYLLTIVSQDSRFDRAVRKQADLTVEEKRGLSLFVTEYDPARGLKGADCFHCHGGTLFTDNLFHNNGLGLGPDDADIGLMAVTGDESDRRKFKTPSLRNIAVTGPYMHDGRFATLEEVVEHYNSGVARTTALDPNLAKHPAAGLGMGDSDKKALVAFLKTLTEDRLSPAGANPSVTTPAEKRNANTP